MPVPEAPMREEAGGLTPAGPGWFVVNVADALAKHHEIGGSYVPFENRDVERFPQFGINVHVLQPGQPNAKYHSEPAQEAFLVLEGECLLIVEGQERRMKQWDFFSCPPGTDHVMVGAGDGPCAILMVGTRLDPDTADYPPSELAAKYGAEAPQPTTGPSDAYRDWPSEFKPGKLGWPTLE
ncbi:MAG: cupin domain-containing protein [Thermoleophilaceae bacterium]